jgi:uncharacterized protein YcbX
MIRFVWPGRAAKLLRVATTVAEIWRYPVKSMQGERIEHGLVSDLGLDGDRRWALRDTAGGKLVSGKRNRDILMASARLEGASVLIILPDGTELYGDDARVDDALSEWLGHGVTLQHAGPDTSGVYDYYVDPEDETSEVIEFPTPDGTFLDAGAIHILTTASIRAVAATAPGSDWAVRRFRPTILVEGGDGDGYPEDAWVGSEWRVGAVTVDILMKTIRCSVPGRAQPGIVADVDVLRVLKRERNAQLGVYASVVTPGEIRVGDDVGPKS